MNKLLFTFLLPLGVTLWLLGLKLYFIKETILVDWFIVKLLPVEVTLPLVCDPVSALFLGTVSLISASVILFSSSYMAQEKFYVRFHLLVLSFIASMGLLIMSPNLLTLMLGWDGLGVTSFLLVVYFQSAKAYNAGMLTVLTNRLGDLMLLLSIALTVELGHWSIFNLSGSYYEKMFLVSLLILAASTKSAQVPFSAWLPAAMAAPTPVSSLVHSSTLVTAGIYLMLRLTGWLTSSGAVFIILVMGVMTMLLAGASALSESDMKKVVALSTLSQLGLMAGCLGLGLYHLAFIHLLSHAFFKALLFMSVGNSIHLSEDYQDMRKVYMSPLSGMTMSFSLVANLSLCGFPFLSGFYSKDLILESLSSLSSGMLVWFGFFLATALTSAYTTRFLCHIMASLSRSSSLTFQVDKDLGMMKAMTVLWPLAIGGAVFLLWSFNVTIHTAMLPMSLKLFTAVVIIAGGFTGVGFSLSMTSTKISWFHWSWGTMWALPLISSTTFLPFFFTCSKVFFLADKSWVWWVTLGPLVSGGAKFMDYSLSRASYFGGLYLSLVVLLVFISTYMSNYLLNFNFNF